MRQQFGAIVIGLGQFLFAEHRVDMAMAGPADVQDAPEPVVSLEAFADTLEAMGTARDQMMACRAHAGPATEFAA